MLIESFVKQPSETFPIYGSILHNQESDELVVAASSSVSAVDKDGTDATATVLDESSKQVYTDPGGSYTSNALAIRVRAGTVTAAPYKITFTLVTTKGNTYELDVKMAIHAF